MSSAPSSPREPIMVTRATLPPLREYMAYLEQIWNTHVLTNNGIFVRKLEERLRDILGCPELWFVNNCTTALQIALKALGLGGEVITTPFSYVATTSAILWENATPVFVDVRPEDLTIDPAQVEAAITPRTSAILATHVYGFPCDVAEIESLARRHGIKVIYDAAHSFGCRLNGRSLADYGDISCLSFHATKLFHTVEGGALVINRDPVTSEKVRLMRSFGHHRDDHRHLGINGKNSEFHAAMGLCNLPRFAEIAARRREQHEYYTTLLQASALHLPRSRAANFEHNYAYFPVLLPSEDKLEQALDCLARHNIYPRRYFYPSLNRIPYAPAGRTCPVSEQAARTVLCLPMSEIVTPDIQRWIVAEVLAAHASPR